MDANKDKVPSVVIVGAGLAGLAAATALAPRGFQRHPAGGARPAGRPGRLLHRRRQRTAGRCLPARQHGLLHQPRPLLPHRRHRPLAPAPAVPLFHDARSAAQPLPGRSLAGPASPGAQLPGDPLPDGPWKSSASPGAWPACNERRRTPIRPSSTGCSATARRRAPSSASGALVLTSALNETPERIGLRYARKVFVDGFLRHRRGFEVELPTVPLGRLYGEELQELAGTARRRSSCSRAAPARCTWPTGKSRRLELRRGRNSAGRLVHRRRAVRSPARSAARTTWSRPTRTSPTCGAWKPRRSPACICGSTGPSWTCRTSC